MRLINLSREFSILDKNIALIANVNAGVAVGASNEAIAASILGTLMLGSLTLDHIALFGFVWLSTQVICAIVFCQ